MCGIPHWLFTVKSILPKMIDLSYLYLLFSTWYLGKYCARRENIYFLKIKYLIVSCLIFSGSV
ncbi:hypothetical protein HMPREF9446_02945 [Bacteroides fluxus YIT 12057]|uniref:Uncharacterized protein n=1 Tax=Bacteroides fluxus YIT 12057 TaxID=763034 RepID=F3PW16_9BACE|nr:hypothetical protein HMPREF9446_02945 [Bacteroides fluxus YIT 12057]